MLNNDLSGDLKRLRLPAMADNLELRAREAEEGKLGYLEFTSLLVQDELASRESNSFQKRLKVAGVASRMTFEFFDYDFNAAVLSPAVSASIWLHAGSLSSTGTWCWQAHRASASRT